MRLIHPLTAAALVAIPTIALAQAAETEQPGASSGAPRSSAMGASPSMSSPSADAAASVTAGLPVKDKSGATIGSVTDVKTDAAGKKVATIRMSADSFAVDASALAVDHGAAVINATQAEIKAMMPKGK